MRLPTIDLLITSAARTARRFPFVIATAIVAAAAGYALVENSFDPHPVAERWLAVASLGLPLLFALTLVAERRAIGAAQALFPFAGVAVLAVVWWYWPRWPIAQALRYAQLSAAFHLFVAFAPYAVAGEQRGFWQYNKGLFLRFLTAALYTSVLYGGLAIAMAALTKLFGVPIRGEHYAQLWITLAFVFNTWFFLGGVPQDFAELETQTDYPTGLRVFTQYVLIPLVAVYVAILTVYLGKVVLTRQWPSGWIGYLVSSVAAVGMLAWLLVHPLEERAEYAWVKAYTRGFYIALMPAIVMLWMAIWKRVDQYGITERRYLLIVLSLWLGAAAVYYTFTRSRSIKLIPATLCAIALLTFVGPWNAYAVSRRNQLGRLQAALAHANLIRDGKLQRSTTSVSVEDRRAITATLTYLVGSHGVASVAPMLSDSLNAALTLAHNRTRYSYAFPDVRSIMQWMHVDYTGPGGQTNGEYFAYYAQSTPQVVAIDGYEYAVRLSAWPLRDSLQVTDGVFLHFGADSASLSVSRAGATVLTIPLRPAVDSAAARQARINAGVRTQPVRIEAASGNLKALLSLTVVGGYRRTDGARINTLDGELFLRLK